MTRRELIAAMLGTAGAALTGSAWLRAFGSVPTSGVSLPASGGTAAELKVAGIREAAGIRPLLPTPPGALARFLSDRYGAFISWGPCTVAGTEISWSRETKIPAAEYDALYKRFNPTEFDADAWVRMIKDAGFRYVTFVAKHHDGFAMWDTKTTSHNVMNSPFHRDPLREISTACGKHKLALNLYYSIADFYQPDCIGSRHANGEYLGPPGYSLPKGEKPDFGRYVEYMKAQLGELARNYGPILYWWFDGGWMHDWTYARGVDLLKYMRSLQPDSLTNNRVGSAYNGRVYLPTWFPTVRPYVGDFAVLEVDLPRFNRRIPWEYTTPANGRSYAWTAGAYGDPDTWISNLVKSACGDGNYILGLEPPSSGKFDPALVDKLAKSRVWLRRYGISVFETRGGPYMRTNVYGTTCKDDLVYLHVFDKKTTSLTLPALPRKIVGCSMLNGGKASFEQNAASVKVSISPNDMEVPSTIVVLRLDGPAEQIAPISEPSLTRGAVVRSSNPDPSTDRFIADGNRETAWKAKGPETQPWIEFDLGSVKTLSRAILFEGAYQGELANIHNYQIEAKIAGKWHLVKSVLTWGEKNGQVHAFDDWPIVVFHPEVRFEPVKARWVRLTIPAWWPSPPVIHEFELYER